MRIYIKNKFISLRGSSYTQDENGKPVFEIKGKFLTVTRKKFIKDMNGNVLFIVKCRWINFFFHKAFICAPNGKKLLSVRNKFAVKNTFKITGLGKDVFEMDGDFLSFNMTVIRNGNPIGNIHRDFNLLRDTFVLEGDYENLAFLTALVIAIDNVIDDTQSDAN